MTVMPLVQNGSGRWPAELECRFSLGARTFKDLKTLSQPIRKVTLWAKTGPQQHGTLISKIHLVEGGEPDLFRVEIYESDRAVSAHDGVVVTKTRHVGSWGYIDFSSRPNNEFSYFWNKPVVKRFGENPGGILELVEQRRMIYRLNWLAPTLPDEMTESERGYFKLRYDMKKAFEEGKFEEWERDEHWPAMMSKYGGDVQFEAGDLESQFQHMTLSEVVRWNNRLSNLIVERVG